MAASERNNFIQSNAAKDKNSFFNISTNILIIYKENKKVSLTFQLTFLSSFLTLHAF